MDAFECIYTRRSVRKFLDKPVPWDLVGKILEAGRVAPSAGNLQNWGFLVVMDEENVQNLKENGWVVWINAGPGVLEHRMHEEQKSGRLRPSLTGGDSLEEIRDVLSLRLPFYERAGDLRADTDTLTVREVAELIIDRLRENR